MDTIDSLFARIRDMPLDPRLKAIDSAVFEGIASRAQAHISPSTMAAVATLSLVIGMAISFAPAGPVHAATALPLGAPMALAPSTLLGGR